MPVGHAVMRQCDSRRVRQCVPKSRTVIQGRKDCHADDSETHAIKQ